MTVVAVMGAQWGNEGKGKVVDELSTWADYVVRYQGGSDAGHRVIHEKGEFIFRLVPSGILTPNTTCIIGNGVVIDPKRLLAEISELQQLGIDLSRLYISKHAHVIMPYHVLLDRLKEDIHDTDKIDSAQWGINPAYVDKHARIGIRMIDLLDVDLFRAKLSTILQQKNRMITQIYGQPPLSLEEIHGEYFSFGQHLRPYIADTETMLQDALFEQKAILLEGSQGALLDIDIGRHPLGAAATNAASGAGLPPRTVDHVIGVYKAYMTRAGSGPMPTEIFDDTCDQLCKQGNEYDMDGGQKLRCGWFDAVVGRFVAQFNRLDTAIITKLDVLDTFPTIKICTAYHLHGKTVRSLPANLNDLSACEPVYEELKGWLCSTTAVSSYAGLPAEARYYLKRLEEVLEIPIAFTSVNPQRGGTILVQDILSLQRAKLP
ncbi:MAG TPA: adenylosuccinate synthase [Ktedonobacteraceae bacterium]|nr:adenylosuccinate synthase [Ktedonobacteraceae bacterium]